jgi:hypothetical protein
MRYRLAKRRLMNSIITTPRGPASIGSPENDRKVGPPKFLSNVVPDPLTRKPSSLRPRTRLVTDVIICQQVSSARLNTLFPHCFLIVSSTFLVFSTGISLEHGYSTSGYKLWATTNAKSYWVWNRLCFSPLMSMYFKAFQIKSIHVHA